MLLCHTGLHVCTHAGAHVDLCCSQQQTERNKHKLSLVTQGRLLSSAPLMPIVT